MATRARAAARLLLAAIATLTAPAFALAHGEGPSVVVTPPRAHPGDAVEIQGQYLWGEAELAIELHPATRPEAVRMVGRVTTDPQGAFDVTLTLPGDLPEGSYVVRVRNAYGETADGALKVEAPLPILPLAVLGLAAAAIALVIVSGRRRAAARGAPTSAPEAPAV